MSQQPDLIDDLDRCRHGHTAAEFCDACDVIDLRDSEAVVSNQPLDLRWGGKAPATASLEL